jgi:hypothetical protein
MKDNKRAFIALSARTIIETIEHGQYLVVYVAPGVHKEIADSLLSAVKRNVHVEVILDVSAEVCRLGYGAIDGIRLLNANSVILRNSSGLRIGLLVVDSKAWIFTPTPLVLEEESIDDNSPNAIAISQKEAERILAAISVSASDESANVPDETRGEAEIGQNLVRNIKIEEVKNDLDQNPAQKFDIVRKVRVFNSALEYVEMSLKNCQIQRYTVTLPSELLGLVEEDKMRERLHSTVRLIDGGSELSGKHLTEKKNVILKKFTRQLGKPFGSVILRSRKEEFLKEVEKLQDEVKKYQDNVRNKLQKELDETRDKLIDMLSPIVLERPTDSLRSQVPTDKPTLDQVKRYLQGEIECLLPRLENLIDEMKLEVNFKGITYETLNNPDFVDAVKAEFKAIDWDKPFHEYDAAPATGDIADKS